MTKKIIKVEDKKDNKLDLSKIKNVIVDNKDTIKKVIDLASDFLDDDKDSKKSSSKKKTSSSKSTKSKSRKTSKSKNSDLDTVIDLASKFLK